MVRNAPDGVVETFAVPVVTTGVEVVVVGLVVVVGVLTTAVVVVVVGVLVVVGVVVVGVVGVVAAGRTAARASRSKRARLSGSRARAEVAGSASSFWS